MNYESLILYLILLIAWTEYFWELYLSIRQHMVYKSATQIPKELEKVLSPKTYEKSRVYGLDKSAFSMFKDTYSVVINTFAIWVFAIHYFWKISGQYMNYYNLGNDELIQTAFFIFFVNSISTVISLPLKIFDTFVLEEKHGFNKQTMGFFIKDKFKSFVVSQILIVPLTVGAVYIVKVGGDLFFVYLWLFTTGMTLFFMTIYPDYIAPLFDKYTPLPDGELKTKIEKLAESISFPLYKLYLVEGSKRSDHSNAYFYGFFKNKRIVLFDTLVKDYAPKTEPDSSSDEPIEQKGCDTDEVLAVLAHELGHWQYNHVAKHIVIMLVNLFLQFAAFGFLFKYPQLYRSFGFPEGEQPVIIGLMIVLQFVFSPYNYVLSFMLTALSRKFEFEADQFAKSLKKAETLGNALIKLHKDNLSFPVYDWLYSTWHHSHPTLLQRLRALKGIKYD